MCCEGSGEPILTHCIENFREHHVEQNGTYKDLSFDYYISVWANCKDRIELQVRNYSNTSSSEWDKHFGLKSYTVLDAYTNKTLTWHAVNLTPDNFDSEGRGHYKFVGYINKSQHYSGPTIEERFDDPKVSYNKTINELSAFDYEVSVWIDLVIDSIKLEVYNYTLDDWEPKGIRNYTTPGIYQPLKWESINLSSDYFDGNPLRGKYKFVGKYNTSENVGPTIEEKFYDLRVTPIQGTNNRTFNYSVTVNANISDKIELQVKNHTTDQWDMKGTRDYVTPNNKTLIWHNIQLNTHELNKFNDSMFRFEGKCGANSSEEGLRLPTWPINPIFRNHSVKPDRGFYSDNFNYNIDVKAEKNGTVKLSIFCPDGSLLCETEQDYNKAPQWQTLYWSANFSGCDVKTGDARYRFGFWYKRNEIINRTGEGPYIRIANFGNERVEPEIGTDGTLFNYTINVTAAHVGTVELLTKCPGGTQWDITKGEKEYGTTPGIWKTLKWTRIELPCDNCGNAEYMFRFIQGNDTSEIYTGPMITIDEFGKLLVSPGNGSEQTEFNFSVDFSSCIEEELTLQVWNSSSKMWENVSTEHYMPPDIATITFSKICCPENLVPRWSDERVIKWRVTSSISNCDTTSTYWSIGLKWYNSSFYPEEGKWNEPVTFFVNLSANVTGSVELQIKLDDSKNDSWNPIGEREVYNRPDPQMVYWSGKSICKEPYEGNTSYRFVFFWHNLSYRPFFSQDQGPKLFIPININISSNVSPNDGIGYIENSALQEHFKNMDISPFTYSINVSAEKDTSIKLVTINPLGEETEYGERRYYAPGRKTLNWTVESTNFERIGLWNYTFSYYDTRWSGWKDYREGKFEGPELRERKFEGPELIAILKNFTIDPKPDLLYRESCNVTVVVNGSRDLNMTLELCSSTASCTLVKREIYKLNGGEQEMVWKDIKPWETFGSNDKLWFSLNVTWEGEDV